MMRLTKLRNISLHDATHIFFPRRMTSCRVRCFSSKLEDAAREDKLDFITASEILFSPPSKPKTFGFDFHLVQFFFACLPSLAVYLVAQYARYDIRKMEAEVEIKKKFAEENLAEEPGQESKSSSESGFTGILKKHDLSEKGKRSSSSKVSSKEKGEALQELKSRLDALEKIVREMTSVEARKSSSAEPQIKQGKQPSSRVVASIDGKVDVDKNLKERSKNKDSSSTNNADSKSASQPAKLHLARDDSPGSSVDNQGSKDKGPNSEANK